MSDTIVKILGWETKGLRIPDWKIDTIINDENIALILMPSGMGKTTTLTLLRYSFFDYSKIVTKSDIEVLQSKDKKIKEGEFNLKLKINNSKIRIQTIFNFENYTMSYKTTTQATEGTIPGLKLPNELNKYIDQEYIEKTFFNLELVEDLFKSSHAERSVRKLYKLDYLSDIKNLLFNYLKEQQSKSKAKVSNEKINQLTLKISKIEKQIDLINQENNKNQLSYEKLLDEKRKLEKEQKAIGNKNIEIKNAIERATARQAECETALSKNYEIFFNKIKNPMNLNPEFRSKLNNFVKNLARLKIPKSVGESFFDDLIREEECVCGNHMNEQMIKKILQNKESILSEETWLILSNIKTKITNNNNLDFQDISVSLDDISNAKRDLNISINKKDQIETSIDDTKYQEIRESIINHYKKTEQIKILDENYKKYIIEKFSTSKFKYNIFHPVVLYNDHSNFKITNNFELIANSDEYIIDFIITPQFNKLNFNNIMLRSIFNNFLLQNIYNKHKNNFERYANKIIYTCILSLDSNEPIFIKLNIDKNCNIIKNSIENYLLNDYTYKHKTIYNFYQYCKKEKPTNSVKYTYNQIIDENITREALHISKIPKYIEDYFYYIVKELDKKYKNIINNIKIKISNQELFF